MCVYEGGSFILNGKYFQIEQIANVIKNNVWLWRYEENKLPVFLFSGETFVASRKFVGRTHVCIPSIKSQFMTLPKTKLKLMH